MTLEPRAAIERTSAKSLSTPLARQERRRLVEEHQARLAGHGPRGLDLLEGPDDGEQGALDGRQTIDALVGIEMESEAASTPARAAARSADQLMNTVFAVVSCTSRRFSRTVSDGTSPRFWCTKDMPRRR